MVQSSTKGETYMTKFEFNLPMEELEMRTDKDHLMTKKMLKCDAPEYLALADGDKETLKHLVNLTTISVCK